MPEEKAVIADPAPAIEAPAEVVVDSATTESEVKPEGSTEETVPTGSEPVDKPLGEKGAAELIKTRKRAQEAEKDNAYLRGQVDALTKVATGKTEEKAPGAVADGYAVPKPIQGNDEPYDDYVIRLQDWNLDRRDWKQTQTVKQTEEQKAQATISERIATQRTAGEQKYRDFEEAVTGVDFPSTVLTEIYESEIGHELVYHLGKNKAELARIAALPARQQIKEMARLEDKLRAGVIVKPKTEAPDPPPTVRAGATGNDDARYASSETSTAERIRMSQARKQADREAASRR